jgi:two-component system CheB/CheR fusion protein
VKRARTIKAKPPATPRAQPLDPNRLLHDLEVHRVELESQNEELRGARHELEAALADYTELFDFAPIGYATVDAGDAICNVNFAGSRLLGGSRAQLIARPFGAMVVLDDLAAYNALVTRVRVDEVADTCELRVRGPELSEKVLRLTANVQPRDPACLLLAFEDVTVRRQERERLAQAERSLRETNARKDEFLAMLSHELRNPLAPIRTSMFVLAKSDGTSAASIEARAIVERQVTHLTRLVDDLLDVTRISRGKVWLHRERVDLVELVQRTVADFRPGFMARELALDLAAPSGSIWIDADSARIVQTVSNVLGNALKFTPAGGRVHVSLRRLAATAELRVRDTGCGIAADLLPHVFEPFRQAPQGIDRSDGGLGLGLAMVKGFVELHGGVVRVSSDGNGKGTEVEITLPLAEARADEPVAKEPRTQPSRRVLVIDDQADTARALETALTMLGQDVRVASDGPGGLAAAREFHPDVVLCDLGLPGMDGLEVARLFRRDRQLRDTYLVALSGYAQPEDIERATTAGFSKHLAKPASLELLMTVIAAAPCP